MWSVVIDFINGMVYKSNPELEYCVMLRKLEEGRLLNANQ
jgi:hypothetical protein